MATLPCRIKATLTLLLGLLPLSPLMADAQQAVPTTVRDRLWLFAVPADGPHSPS